MGAAAGSIAAATVREDEQLSSIRIPLLSFLGVPLGQAIGSKLGRVVRCADKDRATVGHHVINAVGGGNSCGLRAKVMVFDQNFDGGTIFVPGF